MKNINVVDSIIDELVSLGSGTIEITKFDKKWTFKIVNSEEHASILDSSADSSGMNDIATRMFKMQLETMKSALISINDQVLSSEEKTILFNKVNPYITQTIYRLYDEERAKKEKELDGMK